MISIDGVSTVKEAVAFSRRRLHLYGVNKQHSKRIVQWKLDIKIFDIHNKIPDKQTIISCPSELIRFICIVY